MLCNMANQLHGHGYKGQCNVHLVWYLLMKTKIENNEFTNDN